MEGVVKMLVIPNLRVVLGLMRKVVHMAEGREVIRMQRRWLSVLRRKRIAIRLMGQLAGAGGVRVGVEGIRIGC